MRVVKIVDRLVGAKESFEFMHNGIPYPLVSKCDQCEDERSHLHVPMDVAIHGVIRSIIRHNPITGDYVLRCGVEGETDVGPLEIEESVELIDRTDMDAEGKGKKALTFKNKIERDVAPFGDKAFPQGVTPR